MRWKTFKIIPPYPPLIKGGWGDYQIKLNAFWYLFLALCSMLFVLCYDVTSYADDNPLNRMRDETISYFKPMTGKITMVEDKKVAVDIGAKDSVRTGMRFNILREEAPFKHPVTKET